MWLDMNLLYNLICILFENSQNILALFCKFLKSLLGNIIRELHYSVPIATLLIVQLLILLQLLYSGPGLNIQSV